MQSADRRRNVPIIWGLLIKGKDASSSTPLENAKCEILKRDLLDAKMTSKCYDEREFDEIQIGFLLTTL